MSLTPTPAERLCDAQGRPYFLWDCNLRLDEFEQKLHSPDPAVRAYWVGKLMRQAKPDDVFSFVSMATIRELWPQLVRHLGKSRQFWQWILGRWTAPPHVFG